MSTKPYFLITIDTEGDHLWSRPREITTRNSRYLQRFQDLCERYGFKPTYLVNYEMALCPDFQKLAREALSRNTAEIGMHLHAWNSPPEYPLTKDDYHQQPFLIEYPEPIMAEKIGYMTRLLSKTFSCEFVSHRAGRWARDETYIRLLAANGYGIDCSVTPFVSWKQTFGDPNGKGGPDESECRDTPYLIGPRNPLRDGGSHPILELPMTIMPTAVHHVLNRLGTGRLHTLARRVMNRISPPVVWLRPDGKNGRAMKWLVKNAIVESRDYIMFMLHSSELMPGGSNRFATPEKIERLYAEMEHLFDMISKAFVGATLSEYRDGTDPSVKTAVRSKKREPGSRAIDSLLSRAL